MNDNLNARASQLAVDISFYEAKAQECWDILTQSNEGWPDLFDTAQFQRLQLSVDVTGSGLTQLPIDFKDIVTINKVFMALTEYYRGKYIAARQEYEALKSKQLDGSTV
jgi:hypothetical protein